MPTNSSSVHFVMVSDIPGNFFHVYVKYSVTKVASVYPDEKNHDYVFTLPSNKTFINDRTRELKHTAFISNNDTKGNGTYYFGVKLVGILPNLIDI